jgi:uncharacterized membrane protein YphA (DoxX/SURF4 family)
MTKKTRASRWIAGLCWFVAVELFLFAPMKLYPGGAFGYLSYFEKFVNWGYPGWFAYVIGSAEIVAAIMLVRPRRRFLGAAIMTFILTGAIATHIINHDTIADSIAAPIHLVFMAIVALGTWPADWREPLGFGQRHFAGSTRTSPVRRAEA